MNEKIIITTESSADLSPELLKKYPIEVIPMNISIAEEEFKDGIDLSPKELFEKSALYSVFPKTAGISPCEYEDFFDLLLCRGYTVIHVSMSSLLSSCFQNSAFAARERENVFVIDSLSLSAGMAMLALEGTKMVQKGSMSAVQIVSELEKLKTKINVSFILKDTEALYRGGRCSCIERFGANIFSVRPSVDVIGGRLLPGKKYIGKIGQARLRYIDDKLRHAASGSCMLNYTALESDEVSRLTAYLDKHSAFDEIISNEAGCCISAHCGKGCMGIIFIEPVTA